MTYRNSWTKIKAICNNSNHVKDCQGCGMNTPKESYVWQLEIRIPCANAINGQCKYTEI